MNLFELTRPSRAVLCVGAICTLAACSSDDNGRPSTDNTSKVTLTAPIQNVLPAAQLPSRLLPSAALQSDLLPSSERATESASLRIFDVTLSVEQEVNADGVDKLVNKNATATAEFKLDSSMGEGNETLSASVKITGLDEDDAVTAVHLHKGFAGANGDMLIALSRDELDPNLFYLPSGTKLSNLPGASLNLLLSGGWYFNVHTDKNPKGQLRGQIIPGDIQAVRIALEGAQEVPPVTTPAAADIESIGYFTVDTDDGRIWANIQNIGFQGTAAHVHSNFAGANGDVVIALNDVSADQGLEPGVFFSSAPGAVAANLPKLLNGGYYLNVHSEANPSGEVRGQILPKNVQTSRLLLQGEQEVPPVAAPAAESAYGIGYVTVRSDLPKVWVNLQNHGFNATAAHLHSEFAGANGDIVFALNDISADLEQAEGTSFSKVVEMDQSQLAKFLNGGLYLNTHSEANPSGEARGQILPQHVQTVRASLEGEQEAPPVLTPASEQVNSLGYLTIRTDTRVVWANILNAGFTATAAHVHNNFAGANGDIVFALNDVSDADGAAPGSHFNKVTKLEENQLAKLLIGGYYFNVHSDANSSGEVRGQITPEHIIAMRTELQGEQENPPVTQPIAEDIASTGYVTVHDETGAIWINILNQGFNATAAHLHAGFAGVNGDVTLPLEDVNGDGELFSAARGAKLADVAGLLRGGFYLNVHSNANPSGELRGQVVSNNSFALKDNSSAENGFSGYVTVTDIDAHDFTAALNIKGLAPDSVAATIQNANGALIAELEQNSDLPTLFQAEGRLPDYDDLLNGALTFKVEGNKE
ncbi:CHRD domain-containing protein [Hahella sp. CR1]|uniref:CHRD domain-containing protein n=1 Tax=Hahella sp. CR1 TaxID=2992807 RepID=UPI0024433D30|nr:CHRD domain-containing protein [Hahella sp. CR1]MDG9671200.1 CHRD domain-containing protein [Hahella sp. CR1]